MADGLSADERCAAQDYQRVSREANLEAESFDLLARAAAALTDPNLQSREAILSRTLEMGGEAPLGSSDRLTELGVEQRLGRAAAISKSRAESAGRIAIDAAQTAEQIEQIGLPTSAE